MQDETGDQEQLGAWAKGATRRDLQEQPDRDGSHLPDGDHLGSWNRRV